MEETERERERERDRRREKEAMRRGRRGKIQKEKLGRKCGMVEGERKEAVLVGIETPVCKAEALALL